MAEAVVLPQHHLNGDSNAEFETPLEGTAASGVEVGREFFFT